MEVKFNNLRHMEVEPVNAAVCITMAGSEIGDTGFFNEEINIYIDYREQAQRIAAAAAEALRLFDEGDNDVY